MIENPKFAAVLAILLIVVPFFVINLLISANPSSDNYAQNYVPPETQDAHNPVESSMEAKVNTIEGLEPTDNPTPTSKPDSPNIQYATYDPLEYFERDTPKFNFLDVFGQTTWKGTYYPDPGYLEEHIDSPVYSTIEECRDWVRNQVPRYNPSGRGFDYECGKNCKIEEGFTSLVCEETLH